MAKPAVLGITESDSDVFAVRVPRQLLCTWKRKVEDRGDSPPEAMRNLIRQELQAPPRSNLAPMLPPPMRTLTEEVDQSSKRRVELKLTRSEHQAVTAVAQQSECSVQYWILSLIRAALTHGSSVGGRELKVLGEANYQLLAIGRNLNQIAHAINADPKANAHRLTEEVVEDLQRRIDEAKDAAHAVIRAASERWVIR